MPPNVSAILVGDQDVTGCAARDPDVYSDCSDRLLDGRPTGPITYHPSGHRRPSTHPVVLCEHCYMHGRPPHSPTLAGGRRLTGLDLALTLARPYTFDRREAIFLGNLICGGETPWVCNDLIEGIS